VATPSSLFVGQRFLSIEAYDTVVTNYLNRHNYKGRRKQHLRKRAHANWHRMSIRWMCIRSGKVEKVKKDSPKSRPNRTTMKCNCSFYISGQEVNLADNSGVDKGGEIVICGLNLVHDNGCTGNDQTINHLVEKRGGRKYPVPVLEHLKCEIQGGRYTTANVQNWLADQGMHHVTLEEATNIRYRIMKNLPIRGWEPKKISAEDMGPMADYIFNSDLATEVTAGGQDSIDKLCLVHKGLASQVKGYDYRITTDSMSRFTGTSWQTGRMRSRLRRHGRFIFIDDSRSGINTSGFCFWNVIVVDQDFRAQVAMGAMTMHASNEAVSWVLSSMISMAPDVEHVIKGLMSDLGESLSFP